MRDDISSGASLLWKDSTSWPTALPNTFPVAITSLDSISANTTQGRAVPFALFTLLRVSVALLRRDFFGDNAEISVLQPVFQHRQNMLLRAIFRLNHAIRQLISQRYTLCQAT
jgi:hypothetical protein